MVKRVLQIGKYGKALFTGDFEGGDYGYTGSAANLSYSPGAPGNLSINAETGNYQYTGAQAQLTPSNVGPNAFARDVDWNVAGATNGADAWSTLEERNADSARPDNQSYGVKYSNTNQEGSLPFSGQCHINLGEGSWGYQIQITRFLAYNGYGKGDELWWQGRYYFGSNWYVTDGQKFMRLPKTENPAKIGFFLKAQASGQTGAHFKIGAEINSSAVLDLVTPNAVPSGGSSHTFEIYVKLDNVRSDRGGNGHVRIWHNDTPLTAYDLDYATYGSGPYPYLGASTYKLPLATLVSATDRLSGTAQLHHAFNNNAPQDMDVWHQRQIFNDNTTPPSNICPTSGVPFIGNV